MSEDQQQNKQIDRLEKHFSQFEDRFDSHLEVYRENGKEMAGLKVEIKHLRKDIGTLTTAVKESVTDTSLRLRALENWRWYIIGGLVVLTMAAGVVIALVNNSLDYRIKTVIQEELNK